MTDPWAPEELVIPAADWVPGDELPGVGPGDGIARPLLQFIDDDGLSCHEPTCWCEVLLPGDKRAMRWYPGVEGS